MEIQKLLDKINLELKDNSQKLIAEIKPIVSNRFSPDAVSLEFEIFPNGSQGYDITGFVMNENYSQIDTLSMLSWRNGGILRGREYCLEQSDNCPPVPEKIEDYSDPEEKIYEMIISWFFECWKSAGGQLFKLKCNIRIHDSSRYLDLRSGVWVNED